MQSIEDALTTPLNIIQEDGLRVYQKLYHENKKPYLLRIFVNEKNKPPLVVTAYRTSKINKYLLP